METFITELRSLAKNRIILWGGILGLTGIILCSHTTGNTGVTDPKEHSIQVTGSSEMSIVPDEIEFIVGISEDCSSSASTKKSVMVVTKVETVIKEKLEALGIKKEDIKCEASMDNYWWWYENRHIQVKKEIKFKTNDFALINKFVNEIDVKGIQYMRLGELSHTKITEYRKQVKSDALKAAKEKAGYLLEGIGKKAGNVINVIELADQSNNYYYPYYNAYSNYVSNNESNKVSYSGGNYGGSEIRNIKLRYEIQSSFEIVN